jgi:hypothetical protein
VDWKTLAFQSAFRNLHSAINYAVAEVAAAPVSSAIAACAASSAIGTRYGEQLT